MFTTSFKTLRPGRLWPSSRLFLVTNHQPQKPSKAGACQRPSVVHRDIHTYKSRSASHQKRNYSMQAIRFHPPGGPERLKQATEPKPQLSAGEALIKVSAVGIIAPELYWPIYQSEDGSYITHIPGHDFSGVVEEVGPEWPSDAVIGKGSEVFAFTFRDKEGAMAEYAKATLNEMALKPRGLSLVEAASVPLSALTAWQMLFEHGGLKAGQKLLVTGAAGGTGIFAVQLAKHFGVEVIGTASSERSFELLRGFGIDKIINYKETRLEDAVQDVDLVLETAGGESLQQSFKTLKKGGTLISINEFDAEEQGKKVGVTAKFFIVSQNVKHLEQIAELFNQGVLKTVVDSVFKMENVQDAFKKGFESRTHGKIVLSISED